ncbi:MAG: twin-arginine translocation signal domain-containing protein [Armatimonadetes bacterium]|nr:twin-arginine translocation signal domain-containing protein [Armatimonadota bacterium]
MTKLGEISRRDFLRIAASSAAGAVLASQAEGESVDQSETKAPNRVWKQGEPYEPIGRRIVFTNWHWIRPGSLGWYDNKGENVTVRGSQGPWDAHFRRIYFPHGIRLVAQPAQRVGPLLKPEKPWESEAGVRLVTVIQDNNRYRAWAAGEYGEYFESNDGINWDRPELGIVDHGGSKKNNLVNMKIDGSGTVFIDPSAPPSERYKFVWNSVISEEQFETIKKKRPGGWDQKAVRKDVGHVYAVSGAVSPDGLNWNLIPEPLVVEHSDTQVTGYYDQRLKKYVIYTRNYMIGPTSTRAEDNFRAWWEMGRRSIGRTESSNFREFPVSTVILEPGPDMPPSDLLYTNAYTTVPGAPDHHLMFPTVWHAAADDSTSVHLASSQDGRVWHFVPGGAVLETSSFGEWDGGCVFASPNLVELPDGAFALPYCGFSVPHKYPRGQWKYGTGYAVWPKGRLVALEAVELGEFSTALLFPPGRKMRINADVRRGGGILVEVTGADGRVLNGRSFDQCVPIIGNHYRTVVAWKSGEDLGHIEGTPIMLHFKLDRARLFGLEFE